MYIYIYIHTRWIGAREAVSEPWFEVVVVSLIFVKFVLLWSTHSVMCVYIYTI